MNEELRNKDNLINSLLHQLAKQTECITSLDNRFSNNVSCMYDHVKPNIREFYPKHIILHVGTNGLKSSKTASQISRSVIDLVLSLKAQTNAVTISLIVPRKDNLNNKAQEVILTADLSICVVNEIPLLLTTLTPLTLKGI